MAALRYKLGAFAQHKPTCKSLFVSSEGANRCYCRGYFSHCKGASHRNRIRLLISQSFLPLELSFVATVSSGEGTTWKEKSTSPTSDLTFLQSVSLSLFSSATYLRDELANVITNQTACYLHDCEGSIARFCDMTDIQNVSVDFLELGTKPIWFGGLDVWRKGVSIRN